MRATGLAQTVLAKQPNCQKRDEDKRQIIRQEEQHQINSRSATSHHIERPDELEWIEGCRGSNNDYTEEKAVHTLIMLDPKRNAKP